MRFGWRRAGSVVSVVVLLAGCGSAAHGTGGPSSSVAATHILNGTLHLAADGTGSAGDPCSGSGGYSDIAGGSQVQVADQAGTILAVGQLDRGVSDGSYGCDFNFVVSGVPDAAFYQVTIGHRGKLDYSRSQLLADGWNLQLSLG